MTREEMSKIISEKLGGTFSEHFEEAGYVDAETCSNKEFNILMSLDFIEVEKVFDRVVKFMYAEADDELTF